MYIPKEGRVVGLLVVDGSATMRRIIRACPKVAGYDDIDEILGA
jgi:hypothetical protein